jgi:hypothetical protein
MPLNEKSFVEMIDSDSDEIDLLMRLAVRDALREHRRLGHLVAVWRDGKTIILSPEEIEVPETDEDLEEAVTSTTTSANGTGH